MWKFEENLFNKWYFFIIAKQEEISNFVQSGLTFLTHPNPQMSKYWKSKICFSVHAWTEDNILHLEQKPVKYSTCKQHFKQSQTREWPENSSTSYKKHFDLSLWQPCYLHSFIQRNVIISFKIAALWQSTTNDLLSCERFEPTRHLLNRQDIILISYPTYLFTTLFTLVFLPFH